MTLLKDAEVDGWVDVGCTVDTQTSISEHEPVDLGPEFYTSLETAAVKRLQHHKSAIFAIDLTAGNIELWDVFVQNLPPQARREYSCTSCKNTASAYGNLALVEDDGELIPLLWSTTNVHQQFQPALSALRAMFRGKRVTKELKVTSALQEIGEATKGPYPHLHLRFPDDRVRAAEYAGFESAPTEELAAMLRRVLADYDTETVRKTYSILSKHKLPNAHISLAAAKWLLDLMKTNTLATAKNEDGHHNLLCRYSASAFTGCLKQLRSGVLAELLKGVKQGLAWSTLERQWHSLTAPDSYLRPSELPSSGNKAAAERLMGQLGLTNADFDRRMLVQDDVPKDVIMWFTKSAESATDNVAKHATRKGVFQSVRTKEDTERTLNYRKLRNTGEPAIQITFTRFVEKVLPETKRLECMVAEKERISILITGNPGTKPLMQWHNKDNLASHYLWLRPPAVTEHNLQADTWNEVRCLIPFPHLWDGAPTTTTFPLLDPEKNVEAYKPYHKQHSFAYLFCLDDFREPRLDQLMLFPQFMKSEFHAVRKTIEAYSQQTNRQTVPDALARGGYVGGVRITQGQKDKVLLRATDLDGNVEKYEVVLFE